MHFESYVFEKDVEASKQQEVYLERPILIGTIIFLLGFLLAILEFLWLTLLLYLIGGMIYYTGYFKRFYSKDKGTKPASLTITDTFIQLNLTKFPYSDITNLYFEIIDCEDEISGNSYRKAQGNRNCLSFTYEDRHIDFNFYIGNLRHYNDLIDFCEQRGINHNARKTWL